MSFLKRTGLLSKVSTSENELQEPTQENPSGGFIEREAPLHISNVMVVNNGTPTRVGYKVLDDGTKIRISKKTEEEI